MYHTDIRSRLRIWPVAIKFESGWTSWRSMARFTESAPYILASAELEFVFIDS
jgi:hypothetical protein